MNLRIGMGAPLAALTAVAFALLFTPAALAQKNLRKSECARCKCELLRVGDGYRCCCPRCSTHGITYTPDKGCPACNRESDLKRQAEERERERQRQEGELRRQQEERERQRRHAEQLAQQQAEQRRRDAEWEQQRRENDAYWEQVRREDAIKQQQREAERSRQRGRNDQMVRTLQDRIRATAREMEAESRRYEEEWQMEDERRERERLERRSRPREKTNDAPVTGRDGLSGFVDWVNRMPDAGATSLQSERKRVIHPSGESTPRYSPAPSPPSNPSYADERRAITADLLDDDSSTGGDRGDALDDYSGVIDLIDVGVEVKEAYEERRRERKGLPPGGPSGYESIQFSLDNGGFFTEYVARPLQGFVNKVGQGIADLWPNSPDSPNSGPVPGSSRDARSRIVDLIETGGGLR